MTRDDLGHLALAVCLTWIAGYVDAAGFLKLGHLFVSFMSGDSTQLAVAGSQGAWRRAGQVGGIVGLFLLGVMIGRAVATVAGAWRRVAVLVLEAALLGVAAAIPPPGPAAMVPMILAMGVQNAVIHRAGGAPTSLTYVTGALVRLGEKIVDAVSGSGPQGRWAWAPYLMLWLGLVIGAAAGAATFVAIRRSAFLVPVAVLIALAVIASSEARREHAQGQ